MTSPVDANETPTVAVVGAGALGTVLARRLVECGYEVDAILSRDLDDAQALAGRVGAPVAADDPQDLPREAELVFLCVPDDVLPGLAQRFAQVPHSWDETTVVHTSGLRPASVLRPLAENGASVLSLHPLQTFTAETPPEAFENAVVAIEGEEESQSVGRGLVRALGADPLLLSARDKTLYHCAATLASNGLVALMSVVREVFPDSGGEDHSVANVLQRLVEQTWTNVRTRTVEGALTGPVSRGDRGTVKAHLEALNETAPHLIPLYAALSTELVRLAVRRGDLDTEAADAMLAALDGGLDSSSDFSNRERS